MLKPRSCKAKGASGQREIRDLILSIFSELKEDDVRSTSMGAQGEDLLLSPKAREAVPYNIEIKRRAKIASLRFMDQADGHGPHKPACFMREDHGKWFVTLRAKDFLDVLRKAQILDESVKRHPKSQ